MKFRDEHCDHEQRSVIDVADPCNDDVALEKIWVRRLRKGVYERRGLTRESDPMRAHSYKFKAGDHVDPIDFGSKE